MSSGDPPPEAAAEIEPSPAEEEEISPPPTLPVVDIHDLDWDAIRQAVASAAVRERAPDILARMDAALGSGGLGMLFDRDRSGPEDRAIAVSPVETPLWIIGDLHGDLLALEAALALVDRGTEGAGEPGIIFLGDLFDDGGFGLEVLLRIFELVLDRPGRICVLAGNHDEALGHDGERFVSTVSPADFADQLNANAADAVFDQAGRLAIRFFGVAPRALFFPDGLLVAHGGFPLSDLHAKLAEDGDWNDTACLTDFVWTRAHPRARRKLPNRYTRGSQYGYEDFAAFCAVAADLGRPVTHMVRGHDHPEERYAFYPAYAAHPVLTIVALSRRLPREGFGPHERIPTVARYVAGSLPELHRLHIPSEIVREVYPDEDDAAADRPEGGGVPE